jgi:Tfp pilus assembly protein PilF
VAERRARRVTLALAASVLALVTVGAVGGLWVQRQQAERAAEAVRQRQAVETALAKAGDLGRQGRWPEARAVLEQTRDRLGDAGPQDLRRRVEQASADLALVDRLDAIRLRCLTLVEGKLDYRGAEGDYATAFREAGLAEESEEAATVAGRLRASAVRDQLVAALDDWAAVTEDQKRRAWLLAVARAADPGVWRDRLRNPEVWRDRGKLEALAKELLDDEKQLARQTPQLLCTLGGALFFAQADALPLLAAAQARYPDDFWLNAALGDVLNAAKKYDDAVGFYRGAVAARPSAASVRNNLGNVLFMKGQPDVAIQEYRTAIALDPKFALPHIGVGNVLQNKGQLDGAMQEYRTAIALGPKEAMPHYDLGNLLRDKGQLDAAMSEYRTAIALDDKLAPPHNNLGNVLRDTGQLDAAMLEYRRAIALDPKYAAPHINLGRVLRDKGQLDVAMLEYRTAIALDAKLALPHNNLGNALADTGQLDAAMLEYGRAIELDRKFAPPHNGLGSVLRDKGQLDAAMSEYRRAIELDRKDAAPHNGLGNALCDKGQLDAAMSEYRTAIALDPKLALPHCNLGNALCDKGQLDAAIQEFRRAIALNPSDAGAYFSLGGALRNKGLLAESLAAFREGHRLGSAQPGWRLPSAQWVQEAEGLVAADRKLAAVRDGKEKPASDAERLALAHLCRQPFKQLYAASYRFYAEAFAHDARPDDDVQRHYRYNAACAAALAGCGQGKDADSLNENERARLRQQAVAWLRADLAYWSKQAASAEPAGRARFQQTLEHWQQDADLAGLRDKDAVAKLPAGEQEACRRLWADVAALLNKAQGKPQ